jgi:dihydroorotase
VTGPVPEEAPATNGDVTAPADVVLRGGTVHRSGQPPVVADVAVAGDRVIAIAGGFAGQGATEIDCTGTLVLPGLVDLHSHVYLGGRGGGVDPDEAHLGRGVVAVNDTGSSGLDNFNSNMRPVIEKSAARVSAYLNISSLGILGLVGPVYEVSELHDPEHRIRPDETVAMVRDNAEIIRGIKVRLSEHLAGREPLRFLDTALDVAGRSGVRLMVHVGATACSLTDILERLRPGDVVTHCFHGRTQAIVADGAVIAAAWRARDRGVLFDVGHGTSQIAYRVARQALAEGFYPDTIGSDLAVHNRPGPCYDLVTVISKLLALGLPFDDALRSVTAVPANVLGWDTDGYGQLAVGGLACVSVLRQLDEADELADSNNPAVLEYLPVRRLEPVVTVNKGAVVRPVAWAGAVQ